MSKKIGKITKVPLREVWKHEEYDFSSWLAQDENLDALGREIGTEIKLIKTEANVGRYTVDILAEEEASGRKIIIENQLEETNHDHLGKIITYASGYDAEIIIWIVKSVRDEHLKAVEWLNENTDENLNFFLIKIELWQIDKSKPAPKFEIMASPNEWAKAVKTSSVSGEISNTKIQQLEFWNKFKDYVRLEDTHIRLRTPRPQHWYDISMGNSEAHVALTLNSRENQMGCEIYINKNKKLFNFLMEKKSKIEKEIKESAEWIDAAVASRIKISKKLTSLENQSPESKNFKWLYDKTILFQTIFSKYINEYNESLRH